MQLANTDPSMVSLVTSEVSASLNRKIEEELVADTSTWAGMDSLPESAGSSVTLGTTNPDSISVSSLVEALNKLPSYANPANCILVMNQTTLFDLQLSLDSDGRPTMSSDYTASAASGLWSPRLLGMPVVTSGFMTGTADGASAGKTVALIVDTTAVKCFRTIATLRSSTLPSFENNVLSIGALIGWLNVVTDSARVVKVVTAAS